MTGDSRPEWRPSKYQINGVINSFDKIVPATKLANLINYNKKDIIEKETKLREFENEIESEERSQNSKNETKLSNLIKKVSSNSDQNQATIRVRLVNYGKAIRSTD